MASAEILLVAEEGEDNIYTYTGYCGICSAYNNNIYSTLPFIRYTGGVVLNKLYFPF